ncbi:NAD(P)H-hydrate dehydratase [Candidatus Magnetominusculus dajiuhuensis]|uniref:NAD(P)H-hydrate dehydratase n=1 Tax=Candidatus Magnetominusculus dajiuhuensis TaxID=3137712 RepID=UPI003B43807A
MKVVTGVQMRQIDAKTIEDIGIPAMVLMERAGVVTAAHIVEKFPPRDVCVLCGPGNNGGDGIVAARELFNNGFNVRVFIASHMEGLNDNCRFQYNIAEKLGIEVVFKSNIKEADLRDSLIVDALFGTGLNKPVKDSIAKTIETVNSRDRAVVSVDIPSGISSDTGEVLGKAVRANATVTFGLPKRGHLLYPGKDHTGELFVENIGFPYQFLNSDTIRCDLMEKAFMSMLIPARPPYAYKGNFGHVLVVGGSSGRTGAALLAARASMRSGSGLVTVGVPASLMDSCQARVTEEMTLALQDKGKGNFSKKSINDILDFAEKRCDVIALGPGMGVDSDTVEIVKEVIANSPVPVVLDADGINSLALMKYQERISALNTSASPVIITPHTVEMARILSDVKSNMTTKCVAIERDRIETASSFAAESTAYVVLKGVPTVTADPEGNTFINPTGSPSMATAGAGDVLTGMIASMIGQGLPPLYATVLGVYMHGLTGEIAATKTGLHSTVASDLINNIGPAISFLIND